MSILKNAMKLAYIDHIYPTIDAKEIIVGVKTNDIMTLGIETLSTLKELIKEERRVDIEYLNDDNLKLYIGDTWYRVVSLDDIRIRDEAVFHIDNHDIWFNFYLDENIHIQVRVAPEAVQLGDIYVHLQDFQNDINDLSKSPFATAGPVEKVFFDLA